MTDRVAEMGLDVRGVGTGAHGQQRDLEVELHHLLDDDSAAVHAATGHCVVPGGLQVVGGLKPRLALAGRGHHRLYDAGIADGVGMALQLSEVIGEGIGRGGQAQLLGGQPANALAVHGQARGAGGGDDLAQAGLLNLHQHIGGDGLDLGHDDPRALCVDQSAQRVGVRHVGDARVVRDLVSRGVCISVDGDHLHTKPLQRNDHLLAELTGAEQHHSGGVWGQGCADMHGVDSNSGVVAVADGRS